MIKKYTIDTDFLTEKVYTFFWNVDQFLDKAFLTSTEYFTILKTKELTENQLIQIILALGLTLQDCLEYDFFTVQGEHDD